MLLRVPQRRGSPPAAQNDLFWLRRPGEVDTLDPKGNHVRSGVGLGPWIRDSESPGAWGAGGRASQPLVCRRGEKRGLLLQLAGLFPPLPL